MLFFLNINFISPRELKTEVSAKENLPFRILVGHAGYTGRQEDFNRREFTTSNAYFYQDPRCVPVGSITSEKFMLGTEPIFYKDPQKTVLNKKKYTDGFGEGYLKQESTEDMALTSYQRIFKGERVSFIHGNIPPTSAPRIHSHNLSVAHSGYKALGDNHQVGVPLTSAGTSIMSCR